MHILVLLVRFLAVRFFLFVIVALVSILLLSCRSWPLAIAAVAGFLVVRARFTAATTMIDADALILVCTVATTAHRRESSMIDGEFNSIRFIAGTTSIICPVGAIYQQQRQPVLPSS
jgi:hypothetical protein